MDDDSDLAALGAAAGDDGAADAQQGTEPQVVYGSALPSPAVHDQMATARLGGYDWSDIDSHLAQSRSDALDSGYSDPEVDHYLGYGSGKITNDRAAAAWNTQFATDPQRASDLLKPDASLDHPDLRFDYASQLVTGDTKGPQEYTQAQVDAGWQALRGLQVDTSAGAELRQELHSYLSNSLGAINGALPDALQWQSAEAPKPLTDAQQKLASQLPDIKELTDASLGLAIAASGDPMSAQVGAIRENLMEHWAQTGERPMQAYQRALQDPVLGPMLTGPKAAPPGMAKVTAALGRVWQAAQTGEETDWRGFGANLGEYATGVRRGAEHGPVTGVLSGIGALMAGGVDVFGRAGGAVALPLVAAAHQLISETLDAHSSTPQQSVEAAQRFMDYLLPFGPEGGEMAAARASAKVAVPEPLRAIMANEDGSVPRINFIDPVTGAAREAPATELSGRPQVEIGEPEVRSAFSRYPFKVNGEDAGHAAIQLSEDGKTANVVSINSQAGMGPNTLGPRAMRSLAQQFFSANPSVDTIEGFRMTGARRMAGTEAPISITREQVMRQPVAAEAALGASPDEAMHTIAERMKPADSFEDAARTGGADPETVELAKGYDIASAMYAHFHNLMVDQSGSLNIFRTAEQLMDRAKAMAGRDAAQALIRQKAGMAEQFKQAMFAKVEPYMAALNKFMPEYERQIRLGPNRNLTGNPIHEMVKYIEGRSAGYYLDPNSPLHPVANVLRDVYQNVREQIENTIPDMTHFYEDYYRHQWKSPAQADRAFGVGKQGSGMSLRKRVIPTLAEGLDRGLMPKQINPILNTLDYVNAMSQHLAARQILDEAGDRGLVHYRLPGHQEIGDVPLTGLAATKPAGKSGMLLHAYAPEGFARSYNNWLSKGFYATPWKGRLYDRMLYASNAMTGIKLIMPTYHALAMASETAIASLANGFGELWHGDVLNGLKDVGAGITMLPSVADVTARGRRLQQNYLKMAGDPVADLFAQAGGRAVGRQSIYQTGSTPWLVDSLRRHTLGQELREDVHHIVGSPEEAPAVRAAMLTPRLVGFAAREFNRFLLNAVTSPLFDHVIPWLKLGAFGKEMDAWLRQHPMADHDAQLAQARALSDSMDNRFGELNQNNLFWSAQTKQLLNLMLVSTGWEYGSLRAFGNAVGWDVDRMRMAWNPVAFRWMLGFIVGSALQNSLYQYIRTGALPWQTNTPLTDALVPRTGGQTPEKMPERAILPGYQKDAFNLAKAWLTARSPFEVAQNISSMVGAKGSPMWQTLWTALVTGQDAIGHHIAAMPIQGRKPNGFLDTMHNYFEHVFKPAFEPIQLENSGRRMKGTNMMPLETLMGLRPAPTWLVDPARFAHGLAVRSDIEKNDELRRAFFENRRLEAPGNPDAPTATQLKKETARPRPAKPTRDYFGMPLHERSHEHVKRDYFGMPIHQRRRERR